jgi:hypothetical protein
VVNCCPVPGVLTLLYSTYGSATLTISADIIQNQRYTFTVESGAAVVELDVSQLLPGIYFVRVSSTIGSEFLRKFVIE